MDISPVYVSLQVALTGTLFSLPLGLAAALSLARWKSPLKPALDALIHVPLVLPPLCTGYILLLLLGRHGPLGEALNIIGWEFPFTRSAAVLAAAVVSFPLMVRTIQVAFESVDHGLEDAARALGAGEWGVFWTVTLPLSYHGVAAGCVLAFARSLGEFGATIIFAGDVPGRTRTIPLAMFHYFNIPGAQNEVNFLMGVSVAIAIAASLAAHWLTRKTNKSN